MTQVVTNTRPSPRPQIYPSRGNPSYKVGALLRLLAVSRNLERIADLATSIAEDVVYLVEGRIMRHPTLTRAAAT